MVNDAQIEAIAHTVHEAMRAWIAAHGQDAPANWESAPDWMRKSSRESVRFVINNPSASVSAQHDQWVRQKERDGWTLGAVKDDTRKTHPMMIPFADLPEFEKRKDAIVKSLVLALTGPLS